MANAFNLPLTIDLKSFAAKLGEAKAGLANLASAPGRALGNLFGPALQGASQFLTGLNQGKQLVGAFFGQIQTQVKEAVSAFSEEQAAVSRVNAVFGEQAGAVNASAAAISSATGRSITEIRGMASAFNAVLAGAGQSKAMTAELSTQFSEAAINIAARFGQPVSSVFEALRGGIDGMERGVKVFGISLTETMKRNEAIRLGLSANPEYQTDDEKKRIDSNLILAQTAQFAGAAASKSGTLADLLQRLSVSYESLYASVGKTIEGALKPFIAKGVEIVDSLTSWILATPQLSATLETLANGALQNIVEIFQGIPTVIAAVVDTFSEFGAFLSETLSIVTGETVNVGEGFDDLESTAIGVFGAITSLLKAPFIIQALGAIRLALGGLVAGFSYLYEAGQMAVSGLEVALLGLMEPIGLVLRGLALVSDSAKKWSEDFDAMQDSIASDSMARYNKAQQQIGAITEKFAKETVSALDQINDPASTMKRLNAESSARAKALADTKKLSQEEKSRLALAEALSHQYEVDLSTGEQKHELTQKEVSDINAATRAADEAGLSIYDARAKANGLLQEELALLEKRREIELATAKERSANALELAQINRKFNNQAQGLREQRGRDNEQSSVGVQDFARGVRRDSLAASASGTDQGTAEAASFADKFGDQLDKVRTNVDVGDLLGAMSIVKRDMVRKLIADLQAIRDQMRNAPEGPERDALFEKLGNKQDELESYRTGADLAQKRASNLARNRVKQEDTDQAFDPQEDTDQAFDPFGGQGKTPFDAPEKPVSIIDQAKSLLGQMGEKFASITEQLGTKMEGFQEQVLAFANVTAALVKTGDVFPKIATSLELVVSNQNSFTEALATFGDTVVSSFTEVNRALVSQAAGLRKYNDAVSALNIGAKQNADADLNFGGL